MIITNKLKLDLQKPGTTPTINTVQNDSYSRNLEFALFSDHRPFAFPENGTVVIRYKKSDGKGGEYDTLPDGTTAWWAERNLLTVALAPQVLTTPGSVLLSVSLIADGTQLSIFPIRLDVAPVAAVKLAKSEDYFYITGLLPAPASGKAGQFFRIATVNDNGRITSVEAIDGAIPQKGVDYWTDTDRESMIQDVLSALGTPVFGTVDEDNNIILTGELPDGTYTLKYEDADGIVSEIGTLIHGENTTLYTNLADTTSEDWGYNVAVNNGVITGSEENGKVITNFIPVTQYDVLRFTGFDFEHSTGEHVHMILYDENKEYIENLYICPDLATDGRGIYNIFETDENGITSYTILLNKSGVQFTYNDFCTRVKYIRIFCPITATEEDIIITVNEEIV